MGREVRRVSKDWKHPKVDNGRYLALFEFSDYSSCSKDWEEGNSQWNKGFVESYSEQPWIKKDTTYLGTYENYAGERPVREDYMPEWSEAEKTHIQMYETTSEGTPISPVFDNAEDLARWLADNNASSFGRSTATYEKWLSTINRGWAPSAVVDNVNGFRSGVEGLD